MFMTVFLFVVLLAAIIFAVIILSTFLGFALTRVPYVRTPEADVVATLNAAGIADGQVFFELGSGDGRVVFIAEQLANVRATGFELMFWTHWIALLRRLLRKSNARFSRENFFNASWAEADIIYCYLFPHLMPRVGEKFMQEGKSGAVLVSRDFRIHALNPVQEIEFGPLHSVYIYRR